MNQIKFGKIQLPIFPIGLAPMAGVSDQPYRRIAKEFGCDWLVSEMVSAKGLLYKNEKTENIMDFVEEERPYGVQLFGREPLLLAKAAEKVEVLGADFIDLNLGCPMPKIVNNGEGSALLKEPQLIGQIFKEMIRAVEIPVTAKIRLGWNQDQINVIEVAKRIEEAGVSLLVVHGRTREDYYMGQADWEWIAKVKQAITIPVIGNGDVTSPELAKLLFDETGCDGIQIGRGAQGNPWIFKQVKDFLSKGFYDPSPHWGERWQVFLKHLLLLIENKGEIVAVKEMRSHGAWYTKGLKGSATLRKAFSQAKSLDEYKQIGLQYEEYV